MQTAVARLPKSLRGPAQRWIDAQSAALIAGLCRGAADDRQLDDVLRIVVCSEFAAQLISQRADWFLERWSKGDLAKPLSTRSAESRFRRAVDAGLPREDFMRELRVLRNELLLRILWRDWNGGAAVRETLSSLSAIAEYAIAAAVDYARKELEPRFGAVIVNGAEAPPVVIAMGKLGGRELNFSSDVDLVFAYPEEGATGGKRSISAHEYYTRIVRSTVGLLEEVTEDGFVYRVDTRLRPFGDSGSPVVSFSALETYLVHHGRNWERYAYVKARTVYPLDVDDAIRVALFDQIIVPFVYRRYLDFSVFESLREMHRLVASEVDRRDRRDNVKLGPGGIREIEFIVQALQLVRGGSVKGLRTSEIHSAMEHAVDESFTEKTAATLQRAYELLRRVENALQAYRDQQTHDLPQDDVARERLAHALRTPGWSALAKSLDAARADVSRQFQALAIRDGSADAEQDVATGLRALWSRSAPVEEWRGAFEACGTRDAASLAATAVDFSNLSALRRIDADAAKRLERVMPRLLMALAERDDASATLRRLTPVLLAILKRSAYLALLAENHNALERLIELCSRSPYLAEELAAFPMLLDELIDPQRYKQAPSLDELTAELELRLGGVGAADIERQIEVLAEFKRAMQFRVAAADLSGNLPLMKVSDRLTDIAELVVDRCVKLAHAELVAKFGQPRYSLNGRQRVAGLGVVGYGKFGGIELSYASDLDLVFLHDSRGTDQHTDGERSLDNSVFFARLARRLVHFLTTQTPSGSLYAIDTRLRPSGRSGLLVTTIEAFERYQRDSAWTWEHQALLRARAVAGSSIVAREFDRIRASVLRTTVKLDCLTEDVNGMRERMRAELDKSDRNAFDIKQGRGGVADIEFLVQHWVLKNAGRFPALIHYSDNIRQLATLVAVGCVSRETAERLQKIYQRYRAVTHRHALAGTKALVSTDRFETERATVTALWVQNFGNAG